MISVPTVRKKINILAVEDDPMDAMLVKRFLERGKINHHLTTLEDGEAALDFLNREGRYHHATRPDLIILDMGLPKVSGWDVLDTLKRDPRLKHIPVVVLTGHEIAHDSMRRWNLHEHSFVNKWFNMTDFLSLIKAVEDYWADRPDEG